MKPLSKHINRREIIYAIQAHILISLNNDFQLSSILDIADIADELENKIPEIIRNSILECSAIIHDHATTKDNILYSININAKHYEVVVQKDILHPTEFRVAFLNRDFIKTNSNFTEKECKLTDCGQFETLNIFLPQRTAIDFEFIHELVQAIFSSCYNWLEQKIHELSMDNYIAASSLYSYIRRIFPIEDHWRSLWFFTVKDDIVFYLLDKEVLKKGIELSKTTSKHIDRSPLRLISELLILKLPIHESSAKKALELGKCIDITIEDMPYAETKSLLVAAELGIIGGNNASVFPVMKEGNNFLLVGFPTKFRKDIEPILELHRENIQEQFKLFNSRILRVWNRLKNRKRDLHLGQIGELIGGILKGWTGS